MKSASIVLFGQIADDKSVLNNYETKSLFNSIITTFSEKYQGEIESFSMGKTSIRFKYPENALKFSLNLTQKFHQTPKIPFKIGIDVVTKSNESQAKNNAFSLSNSCPESSVLLTENVIKEIRNDSSFTHIKIGSSFIKGIEEPIIIYGLVGSNLYIPSLNELLFEKNSDNSIAVLPFHNTSSDKELDYICDGIAEEIIDSLSKTKKLFVTARTSSFMFKEKEISIHDISRKLNVNFVLDGSIRKRNENYRISYQLVDCSTGMIELSDTLDASFNQLYDTEREISKAIHQYFNTEKSDLEPKKDDFYIDPNAYSYYLKGKYVLSLSQWTSNAVEEAIQHFKKALELVPDYALAYAGISLCYMHLSLITKNPKEALVNSIKYADKSIAADPSIHDGYVSKALASFWAGQWYVPEFEKNITAALAISPCNAEIRMFNGMLFLFKGQLKRAYSELKLAKQLDPESVGVTLRLGIIQYLNRDYQNAHNTFMLLPNTDSSKTYKYLRLAWCSIMLKQYHKALDYLNNTSENYEFYEMIYSTYLSAYKFLNDDENFFRYKKIIESSPKENICSSFNLSILYKLLGDAEKSIYYLEKTLDNQMFLFMFPQFDEFWEEYHDQPAFKELIHQKYKGQGNQFIKIQSDTKDFIEIKLDDFVYAEAQDNYTLVCWQEKSTLKEKVLRATISHIEEQFKHDQILRCHRSYLVNINADFKFGKIDKKPYLMQSKLNIQIPISGVKEKEIKDILKEQ